MRGGALPPRLRFPRSGDPGGWAFIRACAVGGAYGGAYGREGVYPPPTAVLPGIVRLFCVLLRLGHAGTDLGDAFASGARAPACFSETGDRRFG